MPESHGTNDWQLGQQMHRRALFDVSNLVVVITGGGSGIGSMFASCFVTNGAKVYIISRKDCSALATVLTSSTRGAGGGACISLQCDVSNDAEIDTLVKTLHAREPQGIHVLINNAGTNWSEEIDTYSMQGWDKVYNVNVRAVFALSKALLPLLEKGSATSSSSTPTTTTTNNNNNNHNKKPPLPIRSTRTRRRSVLINVSSIEAIQTPMVDTYAYSSGKAAISHLSTVLAGKFGMEGRPINVNTILPGPFESRMMRATIEAAGGAATLARNTAVGRIGRPEDIAGVALLLAGPAGQFMTGASIVLDGGIVVMPSGMQSPAPPPTSKL